jgi:predicted nucleic acid-binding protein
MLTNDASVWINADSLGEPGNGSSRALLDRLAADRITVIVPTLLQAETAGAISRVRNSSIEALEYSQKLALLRFLRWISIDQKMAQLASNLAAIHRLRWADAIYAAVASEHQCTLISLDNEHLTRLAGVLDFVTPDTALTRLNNPSP